MAKLVTGSMSLGVQSFELEMDGTTTPFAAVETQDGEGKRLEVDLGDLADGEHVVRARAYNLWGWGPWSDPLSFTKSVPAKPTLAVAA